MLNIDTATRAELEDAAFDEPGLYEAFNEARFLNGQYETEELRTIIQAWIFADPDTVID